MQSRMLQAMASLLPTDRRSDQWSLRLSGTSCIATCRWLSRWGHDASWEGPCRQLALWARFTHPQCSPMFPTPPPSLKRRRLARWWLSRPSLVTRRLPSSSPMTPPMGSLPRSTLLTSSALVVWLGASLLAKLLSTATPSPAIATSAAPLLVTRHQATAPTQAWTAGANSRRLSRCCTSGQLQRTPYPSRCQQRLRASLVT
mmetsp:Transcript_9303/g.18997  ORF Transcript_9303/g.18997 Transcript_9303/m.18997 type:complete len:201 (+) Transcript_9303:900-1502(+)